jgi:hypothetical protein
MSKARREMQLLGDFLHTGAQAAGTWWRPTPASGNGELDSHEVAEVVYVEVVAPVAAGVAEDLRRIHLNLDGKLEQYNLIPGTDTYLVTARRTNMRAGRFLALGTPMFKMENGLLGLLRATCPKYRKAVTVECYAGGNITADYRVRLYGYRYRAEDLAAVCPEPVGAADSIFDPTTGRMSDFINRPPVQVSEDTWTQLPGGLDQAVPKIFHFLRMAFNAKATTANIPYEFRFDIGNVGSREEDLYFPYDTEKKIAIIKGLGVRAPAHLLQTWVDVAGDERPKSRIPTTQFYNDLHFGHAYPFFAADFPEYFTVPLLDDRIVVANEKAVVRVVDDGTSILANQIAVITNGILIELT